MTPRVHWAVGHGHKSDGTYDPGAVGGGTDEQTAGDVIVAAGAAELRRFGVDVVDEANKRDPNFPGTIREVNTGGYTIGVSSHHDWIKAPRGVFGHWLTDEGKRIADAIVDRLDDVDGTIRRDTWHKRRTDLAYLNRTVPPVALIEHGRIGEYTNAQLVAHGRAMARGIVDYLVDRHGFTPTTTPDKDPDMTPEEVTAIVRREVDAGVRRLLEQLPPAVFDHRLDHIDRVHGGDGATIEAGDLLARMFAGVVTTRRALVDVDELADQVRELAVARGVADDAVDAFVDAVVALVGRLEVDA